MDTTDYYSDTLYLGNGKPASNGEDIAQNVTVFHTDDFDHRGVMIEHAAELLLPILTVARKTAETPLKEETT